jgi:hypothetical protein
MSWDCWVVLRSWSWLRCAELVLRSAVRCEIFGFGSMVSCLESTLMS